MKKTIASERLKFIRESFGWSRDELAEKLGVTTQVVANMELGRKRIYASDLELLCNIFGMSSDQFLSTGVHVSRNLDIEENELINIYESISKAGQSLILNVCSEIMKYEEMTSTPKEKKNEKFLIAASGAEEDSDEIIDYNLELAKQIAEQEERKRKNKKE